MRWRERATLDSPSLPERRPEPVQLFRRVVDPSRVLVEHHVVCVGGPVGASVEHIDRTGFRHTAVGVVRSTDHQVVEVFLSTYFSPDPVVFESDGCNFNGAGGRYTPRYDVRLQNDDWLWDRFLYGFDETFSCDAATVTFTP